MKYTDYLRWGVLVGLFLVPFVPFIIADGASGSHGFYIPFTNLFFPFITGKNFAFRIIIELTLLCYVLLALREPKFRPRASMLLWTATAFVGWMAVATILSVDPVKSFWSNFERMEGYLGLLHVFAWFVMAGATLTVTKLWERFFNVTIFASALMGLNALMQLIGWVQISSQSGPRVDTTFGNATYLAVYMLIHVFLTLFMLSRAKRSSGLQILYGLALVLQVLGLYYTETRGALLGLVGGFLIAALWVALFGKGSEWRGLRRTAIGGLVVIAILVGGFFVIKNTSLVEQSNTLKRLADISLEDRTTQARFLIWDMARQGFMEKPIQGWGQENFNFVFNKYYTPAMYDQEQWFDRAHNQFLDWLIAGGLPAFVLYTALYVLAAWVVLRSRELNVAEQAAFLGLLGGFAFNNLFVFDNLSSAVLFFTLLAYFHSLSKREAPALRWSQPLGEHTMAIAAPIVAGVVLVGAWAFNAPGMTRAATLVQAIQSQVGVKDSSGAVVGQAKDPKRNLAEFQATVGPGAWPGNPLGRQEATEQFLQYVSNQIAPNANLDPQVRQNFLIAAYQAGTQLLIDRPGDARLELFFATFLSQAGQVAEALAHLETAQKLSPQKQQILMQIGATQLQAGNKEAALTALKSAYDLEPRYDSARILYAAGYYYAGQLAQGDALLKERFGSTTFDNDQLLQVYMNAKLYDRAAAVWQGRIEKDPKNVQFHLGLASTYFAAGKKAETIAALRQIATIDPRAAVQMQQLITQIENGTLKPGQ